MKDRERQNAALDRKTWDSVYFFAEYDDREEYPWALRLIRTGRLVSRYRRRFAAQDQATRLDMIIEEAKE